MVRVEQESYDYRYSMEIVPNIQAQFQIADEDEFGYAIIAPETSEARIERCKSKSTIGTSPKQVTQPHQPKVPWIKNKKTIFLIIATVVIILSLTLAVFLALYFYLDASSDQVDWKGQIAKGCTFYGERGVRLAVNVTDQVRCDELCTGNPLCTHYTWSLSSEFSTARDNNKSLMLAGSGTCQLKTGLAHKSDARRTTDQNLICGLKRIKWERDNWAYGCNFQDDSLILEISLKGEDCGPECNRADECTHFTYSNKNQKCKLLSGDKASKEDALVSPDHDQICGVVYPDQIDWQVDNYAHFCQFVGGDVFNEKTEPDQCGPECRTSPRCTHFTWQNGICYFKGGVVSKDSAVLRRDKHSICGFIE